MIRTLQAIACYFLVTLAAVAADAPEASRNPPLTGRLKQVHDRIENLFRSRLPDAERPSAAENPFRNARIIPAAEPQAATMPAGVTEATLLHEAIASLSIGSGTMARGTGPVSVMINQTFRRTGDIVLTRIRDNVQMQLKVASITEVGVIFEWQGIRETYSFSRAAASP